MVRYSYNQDNWPDYNTGNNLEWCITNGLGSYGGASLIGGLSRAHQGLLVASLNSPGERYVVLEQMCEWIHAGEHTYDLETSMRIEDGKTVYHNGQNYLTDVVYDGSVTYHYECGSCMAIPATPLDESGAVVALSGTDTEHHANHTEPIPLPEFEMTKYIALRRDANTLAIGYDFVNNTDEEAQVVLTPWFNFREHSTLTYPGIPKLDMLRTGDTLSLVPRDNPYVRIDLSISGGTYHDCPEKIIIGSQLQTELNESNDGLCSHYTPYDIATTVPPHSQCSYSVLCSVVYSDVIQGMALLQQASDCFLNNRSAHKIVRSVRQYYIDLVDKAGYNDELLDRLVLSADHFLCKRESTKTTTILAGIPWYSERGRDAMIALTGLTLCTKRYDDAGQILFTYAKYAQDGLIPSLLPQRGRPAQYDSADTSLWLFVAVYKYLKYLKSDDKVDDDYIKNAVKFVYKDIFPVLTEIIDTYENGTHPYIKLASNGLITTGDDTHEMTWMNAHIDEQPVTPRHGQAVEINALWYNALCVMEYLCKVFKINPDHYTELAAKAKNSFHKAFWNQQAGCLYDVVMFESRLEEYMFQETSIRPNQLYAVTLPFTMLTTKDERQIVETVLRELFVGTGIRTLSPRDYNYHGQYSDSAYSRQESIHQGCAWSYMLGTFLSAYRKVNGGTKDGKERLHKMVQPIIEHISDIGCIGGISELFDGDSPNLEHGCYNYASSIGEIIRAYVEDIRSVK